LDNAGAMDDFLAAVERRAFLMARMATGNPDDALDIVQDAMTKLVQKYANKAPDAWPPLFYRILQSRINDHFRREKVRSRWRVFLGGRNPEEERADPISELADPKGKDPEGVLNVSQLGGRLNEALGTLPQRQQQAFLLRAWQGMSVAETAHAMGCSDGTIKTHYSRAISSLRKQLGDQWP